MSTDQPDSLEAARAEVEQTREELGETVEALVHKADVKARAHEKVETVKTQAEEKVEAVKTQAEEKVEAVKVQAESKAQVVVARLRRPPARARAGIAVAALGLMVLLLRRR